MSAIVIPETVYNVLCGCGFGQGPFETEMEAERAAGHHEVNDCPSNPDAVSNWPEPGTGLFKINLTDMQKILRARRAHRPPFTRRD